MSTFTRFFVHLYNLFSFRRFLACCGLFILLVPSLTLALTQEEQEAQWQAELLQTEADIAKWQSILDTTKKGTASLQRDAALLNAKIQQAQASIKKLNIEIAQIGVDINAKKAHISDLQGQIDQGHDSLAQLLRKNNEIDQFSLPEVILGDANISDFFSDVNSFDMIKRSLQDLFVQIRQNQGIAEQEKAALDKRQNQALDTEATAEAQKRQVQANEKEKEYLIQVNKTQEKTYSQVLADRQKHAAEIRAALFALRDSAAIPFGDALKYAQEASAKTGVRPAFLLAILTQETNLGKNVGTCNRAGDPPSKSWRNIMPGPDQIAKGLSKRDDQSAFLRIVTALGLDPDTRPLSCPLGGSGWGGAMGPSQFIPTTWEAYAPKVAAALGKSVVNPWYPEDAFMSSAIYLSELGAGSATYTAERTAALKYYAGSNWNKSGNAFYGNSVMAKATSIQETMIDPLSNL